MPTSVGDVYLNVKTNPAQFNVAMNGMQGLAKKAGIALAGAFSIYGLTRFTKSCIELGSNLNEVQNVVDVTFPNMTAQVDKFSKSAAANFGLSETMSKKYTGLYGAMAKSFGFTEGEAYKMSTALTGLAGDVASFYNISQDEAYTKLKSVFSGETETLKDLGVVMTQSALDQYALANGYGKTTSAMSEQEKVALRFAFVQAQLSAANGDFARTADSWANQVRLMQLQWESFKAALGKALVAVFSPVLKFLNWILGRLIQVASAFASFIEMVTGKKINVGTQSVKSLGDTASTTGKNLDSASGSATKLGNSATKAGNKAAKAAAKAARSMLGFDKINKLAEKTSSSTGSTGSSGSTGGVSAGGVSAADTSGLTSAIDNSAKAGKIPALLKPVVNAFRSLGNAFKSLGNVLSSGWSWILDNVLTPLGRWTISKLAPVLVRTLAGAFKLLGAILKPFGTAFKLMWDSVFKPLMAVTGLTIIGVLRALAAAFNWLADIINKNKWIQNILSGIFLCLMEFVAAKGMIKILGGIATKFAGIGGAVAKLAPVFATAGKVMLGAFSKVGAFLLANPIVAIIAAIAIAAFLIIKHWKQVKKFFSGIGGWFKNVFKTITKVMSPSALKKHFSAVVDKIKEPFKGIADWFSENFHLPDINISSIKDSIADKWQEAVDWWNNDKENLKDVVATVKKVLQASKDKAWDALKGVWDKWKNSSIAKKLSAVKARGFDAAHKAWAAIKSKTVHIWMNISAKVKAVQDAIKGWINSHIIKHLRSIPIIGKHVPYLAQGGYIAANTPTLAMIGDNRRQGEIVAPEDKLEAMARKAAAYGSSGTSNAEIVTLLKQILTLLQALDLTATIQGGSLADIIIKIINQRTKSTGACPINV